MSVGMFYPTYSIIKFENISDKYRGTITNICKMPFNAAVIFLLLNMDYILDYGKVILKLIFRCFGLY